MGDSVKMKLFSLFAVFSAAAASNVEIWDEYGNVAYVDYEERGNANFGPPQKGPRECDGKRIHVVKRGKFICKALKKNKAKDGNSKGSKKKKCKFVCDEFAFFLFGSFAVSVFCFVFLQSFADEFASYDLGDFFPVAFTWSLLRWAKVGISTLLVVNISDVAVFVPNFNIRGGGSAENGKK